MNKSDSLRVDDISRLLSLILQIADEKECSLSEAIQQIAEATVLGLPLTAGSAKDLAGFIERLRILRLRRNELVGAPVFRDPSWDMLLELYVAHKRGRDVSVSSLCYASGVPPTTALRQIRKLERYDLVKRIGDSKDHRRLLMKPTAKAIDGIERAASLLIGQVKAQAERTEKAA